MICATWGRSSVKAICSTLVFTAGLGVSICSGCEGRISGAQYSQDSPTSPAYDVVSVKPDKSGNDSVSISNSKDSFTATNLTLDMLVSNAYNIRNGLIFGLPKWATSDRFDIRAKVDRPSFTQDLSSEERRAMLRAVLTSRFHLKVHTELRPLPVYDLVISKGGLNPRGLSRQDVSAGNADTSSKGMTIRNDQLIARAMELSALTEQLSQQLERTVIDKTGLHGTYDFTLNWADSSAVQSDARDSSSIDSAILTALQEQLGLKLQPSKAPVPTIVVDQIELPSPD
jgi:uncharacterized protein (TIGR03435 family)